MGATQSYVTRTPRRLLQKSFAAMKQRCYQQNHKSYPLYGERGITICAEWLDGHSSEAYVQWGLANGFEPGLEIDRIDQNGNYSPDNCRFVTHKQNTRNVRNNFNIESGRQKVVRSSRVRR